MAYNHRVPIHHNMVTDSPASRTNPKYQHQYSELLLTAAGDSDCGSATYAMPAYASSEGSHNTYSTTTAIYHQPNCQCHLVACQPQQCVSPAHQSVQTNTSTNSSSGGSSSSNSDSNHMTTSCNKEVWLTKSPETSASRVDRRNQPIAYIWTVLSLILFVVSTVSLTQDSWLVNPETGDTLGVIKQCVKNDGTDKMDCRYYEGISSLKLPSVSWKLTLIFFCIADTFLGLSTFLALGTTLLTTVKMRGKISFFTGYVQLFAAILFTTSVLFYMVGLDSPEVKEVCGGSSMFHTGSCDIGWNYLLFIISSSLCFLLPVLSHYIDHSLCSKTENLEPPEYAA